MTSELKILLAGEGGQGIQTIGQILNSAATKQGLYSSYLPNFGVEQRGGVSLAYVKISETPILYPKFATSDILAIAVSRAISRIENHLGKTTKIINCIDTDDLVKKRGFSSKTFNMFILGIVSTALTISIDLNNLKTAIEEKLGNKPGLSDNLAVFDLGRQMGVKSFCKPLRKKDENTAIKISKANGITYSQFPCRCKGCGLCLVKCPVGALSWDQQTLGHFSTPIPKVDLAKCIACGLCERICPDFVIKVEGNKNS